MVLPKTGKPVSTTPETKLRTDESMILDTDFINKTMRKGPIREISHFHNHPLATPLSPSDLECAKMACYFLPTARLRGVSFHEYAVTKGKRRVYAFHHGKVPFGGRRR